MKSSKSSEIIEQFTVNGFVIVCLIAFYIEMLLIPIFGLIEIIGLDLNKYFTLQNFLIIYGLCWLISFWMFCLSPKINE